MAFDGFVKIENEWIPYGCKDEKITIYFGMNSITLPDGLDMLVAQSLGSSPSVSSMFKLTIPLCNDGAMEIDGTEKPVALFDHICDYDFRVEKYSESAKYTEMRFEFPELGYFFPSVRMCNLEAGKAEFIGAPICSLDGIIRYSGTDINVRVISFSDTRLETKHSVSANTRTSLVLSFPETSDFSYFLNLYQSVKALFAFICNRQNIALHSATLIGTCTVVRNRKGKIADEIERLSSIFIPCEKYVERDEDDKTISKTVESEYYRTHFLELFQMFVRKEQGEVPILGAGEIHASVKYRNLIDLKQSLHITAAFEFYVRTLLPEMHSQSSIDFCKDVSAFLDSYIDSHSGKLKAKAKSFKNGLNPSMSLSEKMRKVIDGYDGWSPVKPILEDWFGNDYELLMKAANDWRNELAHEKRSYEPDLNTVKAVRLVEHLNYCIVLRKAGYNDDEISAILECTLAR